jgi:hypothetical protein
MNGFFAFFMIANQWLTNCQLEDTNDLLEEIRRQGMTPAERKAEDASRERTTKLRAIAALALIILPLLAFSILSAVDTARVGRGERGFFEAQAASGHLKSDAELDAEYAAMAHQDGN